MSTTARQYLTVAAMIVAFAAAPQVVFSQAIVGGQTALDNVAGAGARAPGDMVSAGVAQALNFGDRGAAGTVITEPDPGTSPRAELISDSLQILFDQLNKAILAFHNLLRLRAGRSLVLPAATRSKDVHQTAEPGRLAFPERTQARSRADKSLSPGRPARTR